MKKITLLFLAVAASFLTVLSQPRTEHPSTIFPKKLNNPKLTEQFCNMNREGFFWFSADRGLLRERLVQLLGNAMYLALEKQRYHFDWLSENVHFNSSDTAEMFIADKIFTDAALSFCKDIYQGADIASWIGYDELSPSVAVEDNVYVLVGLSSVSSANELEWFARFLEPLSEDYVELKDELRITIDSSGMQNVKSLTRAINHVRWIRHFGFDKYVVVNAASTVVRLYECDTVKLRMKAVVGTPATPTPSFSGYCNAVVLYPYWHVPYSIAVNEILPQVKKSVSYLDKRGFQVISSNGKVIEPNSINWSAYSAKNFPFQFRQSTGCDNALGVIKFNLTDPYSVYMHDTNNKNAFLAGARFFSHGCIRLEKPVELANEFLPGQVDAEFLESCNKDQKPVTLHLEKPIPVFVVYMNAEYDADGKVHYYRDVYHLLK